MSSSSDTLPNLTSITLPKVSENTWNSFEIPWRCFSKSVLDDCKNGKRNPLTISTIVHTIVDRVREIEVFVPTKAFKVIAKKMVDLYPAMFQDVDDDNIVLGDGSHTITQKLIERNNYLNRPHKRRSCQTLDVSPKQKRKMLARKAGKLEMSYKQYRLIIVNIIMAIVVAVIRLYEDLGGRG